MSGIPCWTGSLCVLVAIAGCVDVKNSPGGDVETFTLPQGNADRGKEAFLAFRCYDCHRVQGVELPVAEEPDQAVVQLGGEAPKVKTYGELVTAIVNPSHRLAKGYTEALVSRDGQSRMTVYNDVMTVSQLVDIVAFLQSHYELAPHTPTEYPAYYP